jgi:hypothetical protein
MMAVVVARPKHAFQASPATRGRFSGARAGRFAPTWHNDVTLGSRRCELCEVE